MSKLSFRARAVDANKHMPVFIGDGVPLDYEYVSVSRAVLEMPTGMEKDEETEHHLQRALTAQQVHGTAEGLAIPVPGMEDVGDRFNRLYGNGACFKPPKQYIHVQPALGFDAEVPDYDMDSDDEQWLQKQVKQLKMEITPLKFENMIDRLEKGSGQTVVALNEAKALLKEDDELTIAVYDYWLTKRLNLKVTSLIPQVKTERRDGVSCNNPYVAFRRRTEKMQTRKNRKNDEVSYEKMLKLRKDLQRALNILEVLKKREKAKKEQLKLTVEILEKRYQMQDWEGTLLAEAEAKKDSMPRFFPLPSIPTLNIKEWSGSNLSHNEQPKAAQKKREYRKTKHHKHPHHPYMPNPSPTASSLAGRRMATTSSSSINSPVSNFLPYQSQHFLNTIPRHMSSQVLYEDDLMLSSSSQSDQESDGNPDGGYAFKRRPGCYYAAPRESSLCKRPRMDPEAKLAVHDPFDNLFLKQDDRHAFMLASLSNKNKGSVCLGYVRQRVGRGGRVVFDRRVSPWDEGLLNMNMFQTSNQDSHSVEYSTYIRSNNITHYRQASVFPHMTLFAKHRTNSADTTKFLANDKHSLLKPLLMYSFDRQVQKLVNLRHASDRQDESKTTKDVLAGDQSATTTVSSVGQQIDASQSKNTIAVGNQKANLVISSIRGVVSPSSNKAQNSQEFPQVSSGSCLPANSKIGLVNGRVGLSTMPADHILQLNYPISFSKNITSSTTSVPEDTTTTSTSSTTTAFTETTANVRAYQSGSLNTLKSESPSVPGSAPKTSSSVAGLKNVINSNGSSPLVSLPSSHQDNGIPTIKKIVDGSKLIPVSSSQVQLTVQNLLLSNSNVVQQKQHMKPTYAALPPHQQNIMTNSIKLYPNSTLVQNTTPGESLLRQDPPSSSTVLQQKGHQKMPSLLKGSHQVLVRASTGPACSTEKPNRESIESAKTTEEKNKTFAMEVT